MRKAIDKREFPFGSDFIQSDDLHNYLGFIPAARNTSSAARGKMLSEMGFEKHPARQGKVRMSDNTEAALWCIRNPEEWVDEPQLKWRDAYEGLQGAQKE